MAQRILFTAILLTITLSQCGIAQEQAEQELSEFAKHVVWDDKEPGRTLFIPEARLQAEALGSLPTHPDEIETIESRVRGIRAKRLREGKSELECGARSESRTGRPSLNAVPLVELLLTRKFLARATVMEVVAGWGGGRYGGVRTLTYLRIEEILLCNFKGPMRSVVPGDVVAVESHRGRIEVDGETFCSKTEDVHIPPPGSEVLVSSFPALEDPYYAGHGIFFEIADGQVLPQPFVMLSERVAKPYQSIRAQFGPGLAVCEEAGNEGQ